METVPNINVSKKQFDSEEHQVESPSLRDLLRKKEDDNGDRRTNHSDQTFNSGLNGERRGGSIDRVQSSRTLRDIFQEDPNTTTTKEKKNITKNFSDKLFRRQGSGSGSNWISSVPIPTSDVPIHPQNSFRNITRWDSTKKSGPPGRDGSDLPDSESGPPRSRSAMLQRNASRAMERPRVRFEGLSDDEAEEEEMTDELPGEETTEAEENDGQDEDDGGNKGGCGGGEEEPVRMSLMSLLAETDKQMGLDGSAYAMEEDDDDDEEEEGGGYYNNCCVCMVRHKGAAFIPCGHTFCRLCSRELWVQRGNCPLCNNFILEILDIF